MKKPIWYDFANFELPTLTRRYCLASLEKLTAIFRAIDKDGLSAQSVEENEKTSLAISTFIMTLEILIAEYGRGDLQPLSDLIEQTATERVKNLSPGEALLLEELTEFLSENEMEDMGKFMRQFASKTALAEILQAPEKYRIPFQDLPEELTNFFDWIETLYKGSLNWNVFTSCYAISADDLMINKSSDIDDDDKLAFLVINHGDDIVFSTMSDFGCFVDGEHFKEEHQPQIAGVIAQMIIHEKG